MPGDEDYLFDGFDVINRLTIIKDKRVENNKNKISFRYSRRSEEDSSSEGEGSDIKLNFLFNFHKHMLHNNNFHCMHNHIQFFEYFSKLIE